MKTKQEISEIFKLFQAGIKKKDSFESGKQNFFVLRAELCAVYDYIFKTCEDDDLRKMPLSKDKSIAYYLYHLMRIEDITSNTLIAGKKQLFFSEGFDGQLNSPVITTGNELTRNGIAEFNKMIDLNRLQSYVNAVMPNTNEAVKGMSFEESKTKVSEERKTELINSKTVSEDADAFWLVDYWCKKTYAGLMLMPFSRHHMMHIGNCLRIIKKLKG